MDELLLPLLERLRVAAGGAVALVSGRTIADIDGLLGARPFPVAGPHGCQRRDVHSQIHPARIATRRLSELRDGLGRLVADNPHLPLEDKGAGLALHCAKVPEMQDELRGEVARLAAALAPEFVTTEGRAEIEVRPAGHTKGSAVTVYMQESPFAVRQPVFIGDEVTDYDGFAAVNHYDGMTIAVGPLVKPSGGCQCQPPCAAGSNGFWSVPEVPADRRLAGDQPARAATPRDRDGARTAPLDGHSMSRLVVVSNRICEPTRAVASGGLAVGLVAAMRARPGLWFGWGSQTSENATTDGPTIRHKDGVTHVSISYDRWEYRDFYLGFCNSTMWPLLHKRHLLQRHTVRGASKDEPALRKRLLQPDDLIWVHDYDLLLLARGLREAGARNRCRPDQVRGCIVPVGAARGRDDVTLSAGQEVADNPSLRAATISRFVVEPNAEAQRGTDTVAV